MASIWTSATQAQQQGFDVSYYLSVKAAQLTAETGTTWTVPMVEAAFASAGLEAYQHYQEFGWKEGLSPNQYFNSSYYNTSKATAAGVTEAAFQTAWDNANGGTQTSTYFHYLQLGAYENSVNPASGFDDYQYYVDKAALLGDGTTWEQVRTIFQQNGLTPITHYMLYGGTPNEPTPQPVGGGTGTTYTLTTGIDNIPGTALNDTIVAGEVGGLQTLTAGDEINGAGGTNTINVSANAAHNYGGFTMQNVQTLNVTADGGAQTFDLSGTTGLQNIVSLNSSQAVIANNVASLAGVAVTNATATANMTVAYQDSLLTSAADTVALSLNNSSAGIVTLGDVTTGNTGIETVALHSTGTATTINTLNSQITNLTFDGSANVTITNAVADTVKVIDASTATGGLTVGIAATNANAVTFTGGSGADSITFGAGSLTAADTVTGGTGNDTLIADRAGLFAAGAAGKVAGVETITMSDQLTAASTFKGSTWFADATTFNLNAGYAAGATATITTGTGGTAGQAVRIAGVNAGTLTITDSATSATDDQATLGVYNGATANVAYTTNELETVNLTSGSTTATTASGTTNVLNVSGGLNKTTTLNISGADNLTLTTAASAINTVAAGSALGDLNLLNVTYVVPTATTATGATITTGSGADQVSGTIGIDTVNTGAGNDIVTGTQGADSITLGAGTDQVVYTALNQSNAASTDAIADFVSGTDTLDISGLGATAVATGGLNQATFALAQGALTGGGTVSAVFQQDASTLWVDMDGNGTLDANDFRVVLSGTTSLIAADIGLANVITVVGGVANTGTTGNDIFQATNAALQIAGTTIDGVAGFDTLNIQDQLGANLNLQTGVNTKASNIDVINLQAGTAVGATLTVQDAVNVVVNASAASNVQLGVGTGQTFNGSAAADVLTLGSASQVAIMGAGNDTVNSLIANLANSNINGGLGTDTLTLLDAGTVPGTVTLTSMETLDINNNATTIAGATFNLFTTVDDTGGPAAITFGDTTAVTHNAGTATTFVLNAAGQTFTGNAAVVYDITGGAGTNLINLASANFTAADIIDGSLGTDTLHTTGNTAVALANTLNITKIETFSVENTTTNVNVATSDVTVGAGATLTVNASTLTTGILTWNGVAELDGSFNITGGQAGDSITGGSQADRLAGGAGADTLVGGAGADVLIGGEGNDTITSLVADQIVFSTTGALNGTDAITGIGVGAAGGIMNFNGFLGTGGGVVNTGGLLTAVHSGTTTNVATGSSVVGYDNGGAAPTVAALASEFKTVEDSADNVFQLGSGQKAIVIHGDDAAGATPMTIYYVDSALDGNANNVTADDIQIVGTTNAIDLDTLTTANFNFAAV